MMRSLFSGVSGLDNHQTKMDVIGNNIANVNTYGFKKDRATFEDMIYQTEGDASAPSQDIGGVNPKQVGLGMDVASIDTMQTQGSLQTTGRRNDLAIQGEGFFVLKDGQKTFYTRDGAFDLDKNGTLVNSSGLRIQGWQADGKGKINPTDIISDIKIPIMGKAPAVETQNIYLKSNLEKNGTKHVVSEQVYDSMGNTYHLTMNFSRAKTDPSNVWQVATTLTDSNNQPVNITQNGNFTVTFNNEGTLSGATVNGTSVAGLQDANGNPIANAAVKIPITFTKSASNPNEVNAQGQNTNVQTINLNLGHLGSYVDSVTQFEHPFTTKIYKQDGNSMGYLEGYKIDSHGVVVGTYTNGVNKDIAQIALAGFTNKEGLDKVGDNNFAESTNSGQAEIEPSGVYGLGMIRSGALEMSNVNLADEFTAMITTQRGFQANAKTITTSDQMLQTLLTLKQ